MGDFPPVCVGARLMMELKFDIRAQQVATDKMDDAAVAHMGLNRTDGRCLDIIDREGAITAGRLAELAGLTTGAVTGVLDRLEEAGFVRRGRDGQDRRRVVVELTDKTRALTWELYGPLGEEGNVLLERYSDEELRLLIDFLRAGREIQERHARRIQELGRRE